MQRHAWLLTVGAVVLIVPRTLSAAVLAADDAARAAYNGGWTSGTNGGSGFGPWALTPGQNSNNSGFFVGTSANNGDGGGNAPPPGDVDVAGEAWGMYANSGQTATAVRPFTGDLSVGQRVQFRFDNGWIDTGGNVGFSLDSATEDRLQFFFSGGDQNYVLIDESGVRDTLIPFTDEGMAVDFALTGPDAYSLSVAPNGGTARSFTGTLAGPPGTGIAAVRFFDSNAGPFSQRDLFINSLSVVPEPGALAPVGLAAVLGRRRRPQ